MVSPVNPYKKTSLWENIIGSKILQWIDLRAVTGERVKEEKRKFEEMDDFQILFDFKKE